MSRKVDGPLGWRIAAGSVRELPVKVLVPALLSLSGSGTWASEAAQARVPGDSILTTESLVQMLLALLAVIGIIIVLALLIRRFSLLPGTASSMIKVLGGLPLSGKDRLLLIQVGDEQILISASPGRIDKVHDLRRPLDPEQYRAMSKTENRSFASLLNSLAQRSS
jgi:flagellar protein FliO/FliZ